MMKRLGEIMETKPYKACIYTRLSKEDNTFNESNSIINQKKLIHNFLKDKKDIEVVSEKSDDGYTGTNFLRPSFIEMLEQIKTGEINCVIVKDLSRFGRNYIKASEYIQRIFPKIGVRFIAINDNIDTINKDETDDIIIPLKNLLNDEYSRDISIKIRTQLDAKRKNGDYIASFCVYGYKKSPDNKNKIIIDDNVSFVIKNIFSLKIDGYSNAKIAEKLNTLNILTPHDYKKSIGINSSTPFQKNNKCKWTAVSVSRILKNEIYIGTMVQGKNTTPNYKVNKKINLDEKNWIRVYKNHEPIISLNEFYIANNMLKLDTRTSPNDETLALLSGLIICDNCKSPMIKKTVSAKAKKYFYYACSKNKEDKNLCKSNAISRCNLEKNIEIIIKSYIENIKEVDIILNKMQNIENSTSKICHFNDGIKLLENEIIKIDEYKLKLYIDYKNNVINYDEYLELEKAFLQKNIDLNKKLFDAKIELENILRLNENKNRKLKDFIINKKIEKIDRRLVIMLIESIIVYNKNEICINFKFSDPVKKR